MVNPYADAYTMPQVLQRRLRRMAEEVRAAAAEDINALTAAGSPKRGSSLLPGAQTVLSEIQVQAQLQRLSGWKRTCVQDMHNYYAVCPALVHIVGAWDASQESCRKLLH